MQDEQHRSLRVRLANRILGSHQKDFIQALSPLDGWSLDGSGRLKQYDNKPDQMSANIGWCYTANTAIADPCAAVELKLFKTTKGKREEITEHPILDLINAPNLALAGEQMRQLHFTYMNFVGESYIYMMKGTGSGVDHFIPARGKLPDALNIFPAHRVQMELGETYQQSTVRLGKDIYPLLAFIRDLNPDPANPYYGRSVIAAAAQALDTEFQMKEWNRRFFANNARPSLIFKTNKTMDDNAYERWRQQFIDLNTGTENAYKPLLIEEGDASNLVNQTDLDFVNSRKMSRDEILAMWRVSPGIVGMVENVNRSNMEAGFYQHTVINVVPRVRQFVKQLNVSLVQIYDPTYELDFVNPVPEDVAAKLQEIKAGNGAWLKIDEARAAYGMEPLPDGMGDHVVIIAGKQPATLDSIVAGEAAPDDDKPQNPEDPGDDNGNKPTDEDPANDDPEDQKHLKAPRITCECCGGVGKHDTDKDCVRCDGDGYLEMSLNSRTIPCAARSDHPDFKATKALVAKQVSAGQFPGLYDGLDIDTHDLGCIMLNTQTVPVTQFVQDGEVELIDSSTAHDHQMGAVAETEAHVTLLFGLLENGNVWKDKVDTVLSGWQPPSTVTVDKVGSFDLGESYAIVAHITPSPELVDAHERLTLLPNVQTFSEYRPHLTLAYVQHDPAIASKWVDALGDEYNGREFATRGINYGDLPDTGNSKALHTVNPDEDVGHHAQKDLEPAQRTKADQERKDRGEAKLQLYNGQAELYQQQMLTVLRQLFDQQQAQILSNASTTNLKAYKSRSLTKKQKQEYLAALISWSAASDAMRNALAPIIYALEVETGKQATGEVGLDPSMFNATALPVLNYSQQRAQKIAEETNAESQKQLQASLGQGIDNDEDDNQLQARIGAVFGAALTYRANRIATSEVTHAQGFADVEAWRQAGTVTGKEWLVTSTNPCSFCLSMDGVVVDLDSDFFSLGDVVTADGKSMTISYENIATPPIHTNCQCQLLPVTVA